MKILDVFKKTHFTFDGEKQYETVQALLYRHWFVILARLILFAFMGFLAFVIYRLAFPYAQKLGLVALADLAFYLYLMVWWYGLFRMLTMYLLDTWIVTDHRVIDSTQKSLFNRQVAELNLATIQDVTSSVTGLIPTFFDFGTIEVQTAGAQEKFSFEDIPHPGEVKDLIMELHNKYMAEHRDGKETHIGDRS